MLKSKICSELRNHIRRILIIENDKIVSSGTGVVVRNDGLILTARHVIFPSTESKYFGKLFALHAGNLIEYESVFSSDFGLNIGGNVETIYPDLALLSPLHEPIKTEPITLASERAVEGADTIMVGFPDDVRLPFDIDKKIKYESDGEKDKLSNFFLTYFRQYLFKSAMVGKVQHVNFKSLSGFGLKNMELNGAIYWLDNHLTYGGSGGPLVNMNCELLGLMTEKALTAFPLPNIKVPSGTGMALSHHFLSIFLPHFTRNN